MSRNEVELWKNVSLGSAWVRKTDHRGLEKVEVIKGKRTFTITPFDRQINQQMSAEPEADLFRNGWFVLVRAADSTDENEILGTDAMTDNEIETLVLEVQGNPDAINPVVRKIKSPVTLDRIIEEMVVQDAPHSAVAIVKAAREEMVEVEVNPVETVG